MSKAELTTNLKYQTSKLYQYILLKENKKENSIDFDLFFVECLIIMIVIINKTIIS